MAACSTVPTRSVSRLPCSSTWCAGSTPDWRFPMRLTLAAVLLGSSPLMAQNAEPSFEDQSKSLEATIERSGKIDTKHPDYIAAQLDYAQVLARNTSGDDCATRLPAADAHFKVATDSVVTPLVLKSARGRVPV